MYRGSSFGPMNTVDYFRAVRFPIRTSGDMIYCQEIIRITQRV